MKRVQHFAHAVRKYFAFDIQSSSFRFGVLFFLILFSVFFINTFHEKYPDEFDNITGGWFILKGYLPYSGFFTHHGPSAYFISALVTLFSGASFVKFRIIYSIFLFLYFLGTYLYFRKKFPVLNNPFYLLFLSLFGISATYFWGHMILADSLAAIFLAPVFTLLFLLSITNKFIERKDIIFIALLTALAVLSSLTFIYLAFIFYLYTGWLVFKQNKYRLLKKNILVTIVLLGLPYVIYFLYLLLTGSLDEYYTQGIMFNQKYYIYNYPRADNSTTINPIRFAIHIAYVFFNNFTGLLTQLRDFNLAFPYNVTLALANVAMFIYLLTKKKYLFCLTFLFILIFANVRSNPLDSKETDYQSAVYMLISYVSFSYIIVQLYKELATTVSYNLKVIYTVLFLLLSIYGSFMGFFLLNKFYTKAYTKYMGYRPTIYDRPQVAPLLNTINEATYTTWVGPFEFEEWLYTKNPMPSKYHIILPGMGKSPKMQQELLQEFRIKMPESIWYNRNTSILGSPVSEYADFFEQFLNKEYVTLYQLRESGLEYKPVTAPTQSYDIEKMLYMRKDKVDEFSKKLLDHNYIKQ